MPGSPSNCARISDRTPTAVRMQVITTIALTAGSASVEGRPNRRLIAGSFPIAAATWYRPRLPPLLPPRRAEGVAAASAPPSRGQARRQCHEVQPSRVAPRWPAPSRLRRARGRAERGSRHNPTNQRPPGSAVGVGVGRAPTAASPRPPTAGGVDGRAPRHPSAARRLTGCGQVRRSGRRLSDRAGPVAAHDAGPSRSGRAGQAGCRTDSKKRISSSARGTGASTGAKWPMPGSSRTCASATCWAMRRAASANQVPSRVC
jgi:hypothetical protein